MEKYEKEEEEEEGVAIEMKKGCLERTKEALLSG